MNNFIHPTSIVEDSVVLGNNNFTFIGEYDKGNDYGVFKTFQKEEIVVLQENINKTGGISIFVPHSDMQKS